MRRAIKGTKNILIGAVVSLSRRLNFPKRWRPESGKPSRFLIISSTGIGDTIWGTPAIKALKEAYPKGRIGVLTNPAGFEILRGNPDIDTLFVFRKGGAGIFSLPGIVRRLRRERFEVAFMFHASDRVIWPVSFFAGPSEIIGVEGENKGLDFILTRSIPAESVHGVDKRLRLVGLFGAKAASPVAMYLDENDRKEAQRFLKGHGIDGKTLLVGMHPGAQDPFKRWPERNFAEAGNRLGEKTGCRVVVTGGPGEEAQADAVASRIRGAVSAAGKLTLRGTAALIERTSLFITNDTGPMHMAAALRTPTVAIFSPTDPALCGPRGALGAAVLAKPIVCSPCIRKKCTNPVCLEQITVEEVLREAERLLGGA